MHSRDSMADHDSTLDAHAGLFSLLWMTPDLPSPDDEDEEDEDFVGDPDDDEDEEDEEDEEEGTWYVASPAVR